MTVLVTGGTGNVGGAVVSQLLEADVDVRAMVRRPEAAALPPEVELVQGDLTEPESLERCSKNMDAVFLVWVAPADAAPAAIRTLADHAGRIVFLSNLTVRDDSEQQDFPVTALHASLERLIAASGAEWTFLRPGAFATNARMWWAPQIRTENRVCWPYAEAATAPIHESDIAAVAVRALRDKGHNGAKYLLTGPESLTHRQQVNIISDVLGRDIAYEEMTVEEGGVEISERYNPGIADMLLQAWSRLVGRPALITNTVEEVTGAAARSFRQWATDHAADFY